MNKFACRCGCGHAALSPIIEAIFDDLEVMFGQLDIRSALRCHEHNQQEGGSPNSFHLNGMAIDVASESTPPSEIARAVTHHFPKAGVIEYEHFVHIDARGFYVHLHRLRREVPA